MKNFSVISKIVLGGLFICSSSLHGMELIHYASDTCKNILSDTKFWNTAAILTAYHKFNLNDKQLKYSLIAGGIGTFIKNGTNFFKQGTLIDVTCETGCQVAPVLAWLLCGIKKSQDLVSIPMALGTLYVGATYISNLDRAGYIRRDRGTKLKF